MKAKVKSTGEIISLDENSTVLDTNPYNFNSYKISELDILYENTNFPKDYWQKLEHQYAGMAMQGILGSEEIMMRINKMPIKEDKFGLAIAELSTNIAHALVEKLKSSDL